MFVRTSSSLPEIAATHRRCCRRRPVRRGEHARPPCIAPGLPGAPPPRAPRSPRPLSFPLPIPYLLLRLVEAAAAACSSICSRRELFLPPYATVSRNPKPDLLVDGRRDLKPQGKIPCCPPLRSPLLLSPFLPVIFLLCTPSVLPPLYKFHRHIIKSFSALVSSAL